MTLGVLHHQPFVQPAPGLLERRLDFCGRPGGGNFRDLELRRQRQAAEKFTPFPQRRFEQGAPVEPKKIKGHEDYRHVRYGRGKEIGTLALSTQSLLQVEKGELLPLLESHDLAIDNELVRKLTRPLDKFVELLGDLAQVARKEFDPGRVAMELSANPIELVLHVNRRF